MKILASTLLLFVLSLNAFAAPVIVYKFNSKENEALFYKLTDEIRCLVCQNQSIAESNSELAQDLKKQIFSMLQNNKSEDDIVNFMIERYGDYVLFDPPFKPLTWLLWLGPLLIFIIALVVVVRNVNNQENKGAMNKEVGTDSAARLDSLKSEIQHNNSKE